MAKKSSPKNNEESGWLGSFLSWSVVVIGVALLIYIFMHMRLEGRLVCNTDGRQISLTHFGDCHME